LVALGRLAKRIRFHHVRVLTFERRDTKHMSGSLTAMADYSQPHFWLSVLEIIWINVLLSGDNAIVIALACRGLQPKQRMWGMIAGTAVAVAMRLCFAGIVAQLMALPYLKIVGALALLWIGYNLLAPSADETEAGPDAGESLLRAVKIIALADIVMSLDNVIAVAAAANGNFLLLTLGLGISIPAIVAGATIMMAVLNYFPLLVWAGAGLLGWIAGKLAASDPILADAAAPLAETATSEVELTSSLVGAAGVVTAGAIRRLWTLRRA
jgi:YjbE family integral membrane protein